MALAAAAALVLGTPVWAASQALWPQTAAVLCVSVALLFIVRADYDSVWAGRTGLPLGLAVAVNPIDAALVAVLALAVALRWPRRIPWLLLFGALPVADDRPGSRRARDRGAGVGGFLVRRSLGPPAAEPAGARSRRAVGSGAQPGGALFPPAGGDSRRARLGRRTDRDTDASHRALRSGGIADRVCGGGGSRRRSRRHPGGRLSLRRGEGGGRTLAAQRATGGSGPARGERRATSRARAESRGPGQRDGGDRGGRVLEPVASRAVVSGLGIIRRPASLSVCGIGRAGYPNHRRGRSSRRDRIGDAGSVKGDGRERARSRPRARARCLAITCSCTLG